MESECRVAGIKEIFNEAAIVLFSSSPSPSSALGIFSLLQISARTAKKRMAVSSQEHRDRL